MKNCLSHRKVCFEDHIADYYCHNYRVNLGHIDGHASDMPYTDVVSVHSYQALPSSTAYFLFPDYTGTQTSN